MARLRISVVTPSFNQGRFIRRTIDSVLSQQGDFDLDYAVIDGGSTDDTVEILKSYGARLRWASERDDGQIDAINKGLRAATGDVVGWVNSDDLLVPGALRRVAAAFANDPRLEWAHGRCIIIDENDRPVRQFINLYKHLRAKRHSFENLLTENYICQMTAFWRRPLHDQLGYLDPALPLAFDYDLFLRLAKRTDPLYFEEPIACFRWYDTSKSGAGFVDQLKEAGTIAARHGGGHGLVAARTRAKRFAISSIYRVLALASRGLG